ncbi:hypothetical protein L596_013807 [Steinernema carpocapsae]|nr:hypothetical protein L596_013807 [Steinernema carpocapsae]
MADKGRKITTGRPGDEYYVPKDYKGKWVNGIGLPVNGPQNWQGPACDLPPSTGSSESVKVTRPDFRKVSKDQPIHDQN